MHTCKCSREFTNSQSLNSHQRWCKIVRGSETIKPGGGGWSKGLSKDNDTRIMAAAIKRSNTMRGRPGHLHTPETKKRLSELAQARGWDGNNRRKSVYHTKLDGSIVRLDSSYEKRVAEELDANLITWLRPSYLTWLDDSGKVRRYFPDFYLPSYDVYLDPKNDFLLTKVNPVLKIRDTEKIQRVRTRHTVKILLLSKLELSWDVILTKIVAL